MTKRALTFGFGGYADLDLAFGEFFNDDHTVTLRFMPQHPYSGWGPMLAENGTGTYLVGQGDYKMGKPGDDAIGSSMLFVQIGPQTVVYKVPGFVDDQVVGPIGYRNVWQHLAVVREGNTIRLYLNGEKLTPFDPTTDLTVPTQGLPSSTTQLRVGRRTSGRTDDSQFWQFYGLIDDLGVFTRALDVGTLKTLAGANGLRGNEDGLLAGWTFDTGIVVPKLSRTVTLPTASDIPQHVTLHAAHPVPAYFVETSDNRNSAEDRKKMDVRPSKVHATLPLAAGEWWKVGQGWGGYKSHNGRHAFCLDLSRINGRTLGAPIVAAAAGRVLYVGELKPDQTSTAMCCYHASYERVVYMHIQPDSYGRYFPAAPAKPQDAPTAQQPTYDAQQPITEVGDFKADGGGDHLHFSIASITSDDFDDSGPSIPAALENYYQSADQGKTWQKIALGVPQIGDWVSRYPWSPWGEKGDPFTVAPAVSSLAPNQLDVFTWGENGALWRKRWDGERWSAWEDLGGRLTSSPAAVGRTVSGLPDPRTHLVVRGFMGRLAYRSSFAGAWSEWEDVGVPISSAPAIASWSVGRLDVFARSQSGSLLHIHRIANRWSEPEDLGGRLTSAPAAVAWGPNRLDVFVRGHEGGLAHKRWNGTEWSEWRDLGGRLTSAPAVASWGPNRLDVFVRGHEGGLAHKRWNGTEWSEWRDLGGRLTSGPGAISWAQNRIDVFVRGFAHQLAHKRWTDQHNWSDWRDLDKDQ